MIHPHYMVKTLRDHLGLLIFALLVVGLMQLLIFTLVSQLEIVSILQVFVAQLPAAVRETLGEELLAQTSITGVVAFGYNHPLVLALMSILAIVLPARHIAGEIETGVMESILSLPVKRISIVLSLWLFSALALFLVLSGAWLGTFMGTVIFREADVLPCVNVFWIGINLWLLMMTINAYTFLISAYSREGGRAALGAGGLTLFLYFLNVIAGIWPAIGFLRPFSIFHYYRPAQTMAGEGGLAENLAVLGGLGVLTSAIAMRRIVTRDIPG